MQIPTLDQLKRALHLSETIDSLQKEMASILGTAGAKALGAMETGLRSATRGIQSIQGKKRRKMSKAARAKIAAAQRLRWAKVKGKKVVAKVKRKKAGK